MKAARYLLAGAALLSGFANALDPAPASTLPNGWRYKGCYADKNWNYNNSGLATPQPYGVPLSGTPRTLNGYLTRMNQNGGLNCIKLCLTQNRGFTFAATNDNQCWCDTAIAANGTSTVAPAYGLPDTDNTMCSQGCRLSSSSDRSTTEACGNNPTDGNIQRLSLYEFVVSGFRNNACVLKLNLLFLFFCYVLHRFDLATRERLRMEDMEVGKVYLMGNGRVIMGVSKDEQVAWEARAWVSWICNGILQGKGASPV